MKLSVIVPVYNMASDDKLTWCMDSLAAQTLFQKGDAVMEIIAVDDASTDNSFAILESYAERFPERFRVVRSAENLHQGGAKNIGLSLASGEWIGFIDADDWITPDYYERLLAAAEEAGADMAGCDYSLVTEHTWETGQVVHNNRKEQTGTLTKEKRRLLLLDSGSLVVKVYRRHIIYGAEDKEPMPEEEVLSGKARVRVFPEGIFYEDNAVSSVFMLRATSFAYLEEPLYYYLQHGGSTVHTITNERLRDRMTAGREMLRLSKEEGGYETYLPELTFLFTALFYVNTLFSAMPAESQIAGKYVFTKALSEEMRRTFPAFEENPYYKERMDAEEKKLIRLQGESHLKFYLYYRLLWTYRALRYGKNRAAS